MYFETKKLWEICKFQNWFAFKSELFKAKWEPILRISNIQKDNISDEKLVFFDLKDYDNLDTYIVNPWELVIAMSWATTWKIAINNTNKKYYLNQRVWKFSFDNDITKEYCHYFLWTKVEENLNKAAWAAIQNLSSKQILDIEIPLPPLETQKAIVAKLDQIFAELDQTKEKIQNNIDDTDKLWKSILNKAFEWEWWFISFSNLVKEKDLWLIKSTKEQWLDKQYNYIKMNNIWNDWEFDSNNMQKVDLSEDEIERYIIKKWDFLFNTRNSYELVWKATVFPFNEDKTNPYLYNNNILRIRFVSKVNPFYIKYIWLSTKIKAQLNNIKSWTTNVSAIYYKDLSGISIPIPSLQEQEQIVSHLDKVSEEIKQLKAKYQTQLDDIEKLRKSILDKAFKWELIK